MTLAHVRTERPNIGEWAHKVRAETALALFSEFVADQYGEACRDALPGCPICDAHAMRCRFAAWLEERAR